MKTLLCVTFLLILGSSYAQQDGGWTFGIPDNLGFVENLGRYEGEMGEDVEFFTETSKYVVFFSNDAFVFGRPEQFTLEEQHERREKAEHGEPVKPVEWFYFKIEFTGASTSARLKPEIQRHYTQHFQNPRNLNETIKARCFDQLTYENLYPNIDLLLEFPEEGGLKYTFFVHVGGNAEDIVMEYSGADIFKEGDDLKIINEAMPFTDHAPKSFVEDEEIKSEFLVEENTLRFFIEDYDKSKGLIIDPWIVSDIPDGPTQNALEITYDNAGNCAVLVSAGIFEVFETIYYFDATGTLQWTYFATETGDITMDPVTGQIYCSHLEGVVISVSPIGVGGPPFGVGGWGSLPETWRLKYNETFDKLSTGDGGLADGSSHVTTVEPDLSGYTEYEALTDPASTIEDCVLFEIDPDDGSYYFVSGNSGMDFMGYENKLFHFDGADPTTVLWGTPTSHFFLETTNALFSYKVGVNGIACGANYVYTYDGNRIVQYDKFSGERTDSLFLGLSPNGQFGIDTDSCGYLYVGGPSNIFVFNDAFEEVGSYSLPSNCFDLIIGNGKIYACGAEYVKMMEIVTYSDDLVLASTPQFCENCIGTATLELPISVCSSLDFQEIVWSPSGSTDLTATGLCEGWHVATTEWTKMDGTDTTIVDSVEVLIDEMILDIFFVVTQAECFGECAGEVTMTPEDGEAPYEFTLGDEVNATGVFTAICPGAHEIMIRDANGCSLETEVFMIGPAMVEAEVIEVTNVSCFGMDDGTATIEASGGSDPYTFDIGDGPVASGEFTGLAPGEYTVSVADENDCPTEITFEITEPEELFLDEVSATNPLCNAETTGEIEVIGSGGTGPYTYSIDAITFDASGTFNGLAAGDYTLTVKDENDCEVTLDITLTEPDPVSAIEATTDEICEANCEGTITIEGLGGTAPYTYSIDDCVTLEPIGTFGGLCPTDYSICVEDVNGCRYTSVLTIGAGMPPADATIEPLGPFCADDGPVGIVVAELGTLSGDGVVGGSFDPSIAGAGTHIITNTVIDVCGGDVKTTEIIVHPLPNVSFSVVEDSDCVPFDVFFTNTGETGTSCTWNFGDGGTLETCTDIGYTYVNPGVYDVSLTVVDVNGCSATTTYWGLIEANPIPVADFVYAPTTVTTLDPLVEFSDRSSDADIWMWSFDDIGTSTDQNPQFVFPDEEGSYTITQIAISSKGCRDTIVKTIMVEQEHLIFVPNAITPDGDTYNDVFVPYFTGIDIYNYHMTIFNRWGEILFESYDVSKGWEGTYGGGELVQDGVYIWKISVADKNTDKIREFQGHITVIK